MPVPRGRCQIAHVPSVRNSEASLAAVWKLAHREGGHTHGNVPAPRFLQGALGAKKRFLLGLFLLYNLQDKGQEPGDREYVLQCLRFSL